MPGLLAQPVRCSLYISFATTGVSANKIAPSVLADASSANKASVIILLREQADVSAAYAIKDQDARGWFVYNTLTQHAERTQRQLRAFFDTRRASPTNRFGPRT